MKFFINFIIVGSKLFEFVSESIFIEMLMNFSLISSISFEFKNNFNFFVFEFESISLEINSLLK